MKNSKKFISTLCSNDAFYVPFVHKHDLYYDSDIDQVYMCDGDYRSSYQISPLVAVASYYTNDSLRQFLLSRKKCDALIFHGTWHDEAEHSWWDYVHESFNSEYSFRDDCWYNLHPCPATASEFGITQLSLNGYPKDVLFNAILGVYKSVLCEDGKIVLDDNQYEKSILSLEWQSILEYSWDLYPEILSGLTAAKYLPQGFLHDIPFTYAVLITLGGLLRIARRSRIAEYSLSKKTEIANCYRDLLTIGDILFGGKW